MKLSIRHVTSVALVVLFVIAAWRVWPAVNGSGGIGRAVVYQPVASGRNLPVAEEVPVFALGPDRPARRIGNAATEPGGGLGVGYFDPADVPAGRHGVHAVEADLGLLWEVAPAETRAEVKAILMDRVGEIRTTLVRIVTSESFSEKHMPAVKAIVLDSVDAALDQREVRVALAGAVEGLAEDVGPPVARAYLAALKDRSGDLVRVLVKEFGVLVFRFFKESEIDFTVFSPVFRDAFGDPKVKNAAFGAFKEYTGSARAGALVKAFGEHFLEAFTADPRLPELFEAVIGDPDYAADFRRLSNMVLAALRLAAEKLVMRGEGADKTLDPLAGVAAKALLDGRPGWVVLVTAGGEPLGRSIEFVGGEAP